MLDHPTVFHNVSLCTAEAPEAHSAARAACSERWAPGRVRRLLDACAILGVRRRRQHTALARADARARQGSRSLHGSVSLLLCVLLTVFC